MSQPRVKGRVKWFNERKGFGFIVYDDEGDAGGAAAAAAGAASSKGIDIFVHYKDIQGVGFKTLHENDSVTFLLDKGPKGYKAQEVVLLEE
jgi:CspA family cold shock protein